MNSSESPGKGHVEQEVVFEGSGIGWEEMFVVWVREIDFGAGVAAG